MNQFLEKIAQTQESRTKKKYLYGGLTAGSAAVAVGGDKVLGRAADHYKKKSIQYRQSEGRKTMRVHRSLGNQARIMEERLPGLKELVENRGYESAKAELSHAGRKWNSRVAKNETVRGRLLDSAKADGAKADKYFNRAKSLVKARAGVGIAGAAGTLIGANLLLSNPPAKK